MRNERRPRAASHTDVVVLGLLAQQPRHGYEILQIIKSIHLTEWAKVGTATVYAALAMLEEDGAVSSSTALSGTRPARRVYSITDGGRERLRVSVLQLLGSETPAHSDRLVGAAFSWALAGQGAVDALTSCLHAVEGRLAERRKVQAETQTGSHVTKLVLAYLVGVTEAECQSLRIAIAREEARILESNAVAPASGTAVRNTRRHRSRKPHGSSR